MTRTQWNSTLPARSAPLPKGKPPARKTRVKQRNAKRKGHRFPRTVLLAFRAWVRAQRCCVTGLRTGDWLTHPRLGRIRIHVDPAHLKARAVGGPDRENIVPLAALVAWGLVLLVVLALCAAAKRGDEMVEQLHAEGAAPQSYRKRGLRG